MPSGIYKHKCGKKASAYIDGRSSSKVYYCIESICNNQISYENHRAGQGRCIFCARKLHSERQKGVKNSFYNRKHTSGYKQKMSKLMIGIKKSNQHIKNMSLSKGGTGIPYEFNKYPVDYFKIRIKILQRDNYICQKCFKYGNEVHHIDYDKENNNKKNLICFCHKCNQIVNYNRKYWTKLFKKFVSKRYKTNNMLLTIEN